MNNAYKFFSSAVLLCIVGCATLPNNPERLVGIENVPLATPMQLYGFDVPQNLPNEEILKILPNEEMNLIVGEVSDNGSIIYTPFSVTKKGHTYVVSMDYTKYTSVRMNEGHDVLSRELLDYYLIIYKVGIGIRVSASFIAAEDSIRIGSLYGIALAVQQNKISGTLKVQTIGISGKDISSLIPMPSEINVTTIQDAIQAIGGIKAKIYDTTNVTIQPQAFSIATMGNKKTVLEMLDTTFGKRETATVKKPVELKRPDEYNDDTH